MNTTQKLSSTNESANYDQEGSVFVKSSRNRSYRKVLVRISKVDYLKLCNYAVKNGLRGYNEVIRLAIKEFLYEHTF